MDFTQILVNAVMTLLIAMYFGRLFRSSYDPDSYRNGVMFLWVIFFISSLIFN